MAGCLPISRTMSDGEGPSAGEWQRYIYPPRLRLQSQGHWSPRTRPPNPPTAGCRQLRGWTPCLKPDAWGAGGYVSGGRCVTLQAQQCRTRGFPMGREQEAVSAVDPPGCHLGHGADPPPAAVGPWVGAGCGILEPCANKCV